jgi:hypothetical protein
MDDISRIYVVRRAEIVNREKRTYFECDLEDEHGKEIWFQLTIGGCVGSKRFTEQYKLVEPYFKVGQLISCGIVYLRRTACFSMAMYCFYPMQAFNRNTDETIDADTYFDRNRGFWAIARGIGEGIDLRGLIEFNGDSHIPIVADEPLPEVGYSLHYEEGLQWGRRPSTVAAIWKYLFGRKTTQILGN